MTCVSELHLACRRSNQSNGLNVAGHLHVYISIVNAVMLVPQFDYVLPFARAGA